MKAGHKFLLGAALIVGSVGFLIAEGVKETGVYFLTPAELAAKTAADPTFVENVGFKVGAKVVPGSGPIVFSGPPAVATLLDSAVGLPQADPPWSAP